MDKDRGLFVIVAEIFWFCIYFPKENVMDSVHHSWTASNIGLHRTEGRAMAVVCQTPALGQHRPRRLVARWGKGRGARQGSVLTFTGA
jgi:hypothetical protein